MTEREYVKISPADASTERSTCGFRRRLLTKDHGAPLSITHLTTDNAKAHWHRHTQECYYVLAGKGALCIDGEDVPVAAGDCVWIAPGTVHYAKGAFETLIICVPALDASDVLVEDTASS